MNAGRGHEIILDIRFANHGKGPAFVFGSGLGVGTDFMRARDIQPRIVPAGELVALTFVALPDGDAVQAAIAAAIETMAAMTVFVKYRDLGGDLAWVSRGVLRHLLADTTEPWYRAWRRDTGGGRGGPSPRLRDEDAWRLVEVEIEPTEPPQR